MTSSDTVKYFFKNGLGKKIVIDLKISDIRFTPHSLGTAGQRREIPDSTLPIPLTITKYLIALLSI